MALSPRIPSAIDAAGFIPEVWSAKVLDPVKNKLVCVPVIDHRWVADLKKGDTVNVGILNTVTATEVTVGTAGPVKDIATGSKLQIVADQWWEANVELDEMSYEQSQVELENKAAIETAYAVAKKMDSTVNALFSALTGASIAGTDGSAITDDVLIGLVEALDEADVPTEDRVWIGDPSCRADIMKIDKFVRDDYGYGDVIPTGAFRKNVYGSPWLITNNLTAATTGSYGAYLHKEAIAFVGSETIRGFVEHQKKEHLYLINSTALWGVLEMRDAFGKSFYTRLA